MIRSYQYSEEGRKNWDRLFGSDPDRVSFSIVRPTPDQVPLPLSLASASQEKRVPSVEDESDEEAQGLLHVTGYNIETGEDGEISLSKILQPRDSQSVAPEYELHLQQEPANPETSSKPTISLLWEQLKGRA